MEILITKKNIILDSQILSSLMSCARLTDFRFNHDLVSINGKGRSLEMGSIVHTGLEAFYKSVRNGSHRDDCISAAMEAAKVYSRSEEVKNCTDEEITTAISALPQYFDYYATDTWIPIHVEYVKNMMIYEDDEVRILWKAKLDLAVDTNAGIYPVDHKTHSVRRDTLSLNNQFMGQCSVMGTRAIIINKIGFQKTLKPSEKFTRPVINYSANRLIEWQTIIVPYWAKMMLTYDEMGFWPPNFTHCENKYSVCAFKPVCEQDTSLREEELRLHFVKGQRWDPQNSNED